MGFEGDGPYWSLIEHWDGRSWSIQSDGARDTYLTSVSAHGPDDVWAAGEAGDAGDGLIMHWDGRSWTRTMIPGTFVLFQGIDERAPDDVWAVGNEHVAGEGDRSAAYHFDGRQWRRVDTPNPLGKHDIDQNWLTSVHAVSAHDVWATGFAYDHDWGIRARPFTVHWDGHQWRYVATPDPGGDTQSDDYLMGAAAFGPNDVWAVGHVYGSFDGAISTVTTHWDGTSWTQLASTPSGEFFAVSPDGAGGLWAVGDQQTNDGFNTLVEHLCFQDTDTRLSAAKNSAAPSVASDTAGPHTTPHVSAPAADRRLCAEPAKTGYASCFAVVRDNPPGRSGAAAQATPATPTGFGPADLQGAYRLPSQSNGSGQTVAIVDAFDDPTAAADLAAYRSQYGLPPCTLQNGCLRKVDQRGGAQYPPGDAGWAGEISLDLDMVSATCPNCSILLVESDDNSIQNLGSAVNEAVALGAKFVSNSYGGAEDPAETSWDASYFNHSGVAITASSGDFGYGVEYPAASQYVTSVGGTSLVRNSSSRGWNETVWNDGLEGPGSGCSAFVAKPFWQTDTGCPNRTVADVAAVADPATGVAVYDTYAAPGWLVAGGTSASAPIVAGAYALAGVPAATSHPNSFPYATPAAFNDVTSGFNGGCNPTYLCTAGPGYDGPTGLGTPNGVAGFASPGPHGDIAGTVTDHTSNSPLPNAKITAGGLFTYTDAAGHYDLYVPTGSYTVTAGAFGYQQHSTTQVTVTQNKATTQDFTLTALPTQSVSGRVTDGSGHGWPLYAQITIDGTPGGPIWTDPATGRYIVQLPRGSSYTLHVSATYPGYQTKTVQATVGSSDIVKDISLPVDANTCAAPGYEYHYSGTTQTFDNPQAPAGWTTTTSRGAAAGWAFNNPANRSNTTGGTGNFVIVDSDLAGFGSTEDAYLTSPTMDLTPDPSPVVQFAQDFVNGFNDTAAVEVSTNGGHTWTTVSTTQGRSQQGPDTTAVPIPQAAGQRHVQIRLHYHTDSWAWWWAVDNMFIGNRTCDPSITGGLIVGTVTAADTHAPINQATITNTANPSQTTTTTATGDPGIPGGFYWLFVTPAGTQQFSAAAAGYQSETQTVGVTPNTTQRVDFALTPNTATP